METYLYLNFGDGKATVAIIENAENKTVELGATFCSPQDQFIKAYGRNVALWRLQNKKDFYVHFDKDETDKLKWQVRDVIKFAVSGKWVNALDFETELGIKVHELITETVNNFPSDIAPMTVHTNTVPTWAKRAVEQKNFY